MTYLKVVIMGTTAEPVQTYSQVQSNDGETQ